MVRIVPQLLAAGGPASALPSVQLAVGSGGDAYRTVTPAMHDQLRRALPVVPLLGRIAEHGDRLAVVDGEQQFRYDQLMADSSTAAAALLDGRRDLRSERVVTVIPSSYAWIAAQFGIWRAGGIAVPLAAKDPPAKLAAFIDDAQASTVILAPHLAHEFSAIATARDLRVLTTDDLLAPRPASALPVIVPERPAMILYTSGTTGRPKGVLTTHKAFTQQLTALIQAWQWTANDRIANFLPLNHLHGILAIVGSALWAGATVEMMSKFDPVAVWRRIRSGELTLLMGVPPIYDSLNTIWQRTSSAADRAAMRAGARRLRLAISGSGRLPPTIRKAWEDITGLTLHQRWGQTELGLPIIQPIHDSTFDLTSVGIPVDSVDIRVVDEHGRDVPDDTEGELLVQSGAIFSGYWRRPEATLRAFQGGWYYTGDIVRQRGAAIYFVRRKSGQSLKTGGEFVSAPAVEDQILQHPAVRECVVVGTPDVRFGQKVAAAIILHDGSTFDDADMRSWLASRLSPHEIPRQWMVVPDFPRSHAGKPIIPAIEQLFAV